MQVWRDYRLVECETTMRGLTPIAIREVAVFNTEDVAPVTHAHWIDDGYYADFHPHKVYRCSNCDWSKLDVELPEEKYCPHCGAKMDEVIE